MEFYGIDYLRNKLSTHKIRVDMRYEQYDMKKKESIFGITIPPEIRKRYRSVLGWCAKGVDSLADRLVFREFEHDDFEVNEIFEANNPDVFFDSLVLSSLIASCSFVYISKGEGDIPRLQIIEASNATGVIDPITGLLNEGYAVLERDKDGNPAIEAYFLPGTTYYYYADKEIPDEPITQMQYGRSVDLESHDQACIINLTLSVLWNVRMSRQNFILFHKNMCWVQIKIQNRWIPGKQQFRRCLNLLKVKTVAALQWVNLRLLAWHHLQNN